MPEDMNKHNLDTRTKQELIFQSNELIESKYRLSTNEQKIVMYLLSVINKDDEDFWTYRVSMKDLGILPEDIKKSCRSVMSKVIEIETQDQEKSGWIMTHWFSHIEYIKHSSYLEFSFSPKLKPYLLNLKKKFTVIDLEHVLEMKSSYSVRIYQLLKQYQGIGKRKFQIDDLREIMKVPKSYTIKNFTKIIQTAQKEMNNSDLRFDYEYTKLGRRYNWITFLLETQDHNLYDFIQEKRKHVGLVLMETNDKVTGKRIKLSVSESGMLYNKLDPDWNITKERSQEIWKILYDLRNKGI